MTETRARYPLIIMNTDCSDKKGRHWWSFLDLHPKNRKSFYLTVLGLKASKNLFYRTIEKLLIRFYLELKNLKKKVIR